MGCHGARGFGSIAYDSSLGRFCRCGVERCRGCLPREELQRVVLEHPLVFLACLVAEPTTAAALVALDPHACVPVQRGPGALLELAAGDVGGASCLRAASLIERPEALVLLLAVYGAVCREAERSGAERRGGLCSSGAKGGEWRNAGEREREREREREARVGARGLSTRAQGAARSGSAGGSRQPGSCGHHLRGTRRLTLSLDRAVGRPPVRRPRTPCQTPGLTGRATLPARRGPGDCAPPRSGSGGRSTVTLLFRRSAGLSCGSVACYAGGGERSPSEGSFVGASVAMISSAPASRLTNSRTGSFCPAALRASGPSRVHSSASRLSASAR